MRFLLVPGNNSLSHLAKCLAIKQTLLDRGHEAVIAVSTMKSDLFRQMGGEHVLLPDIQESDGSGFPTVEWFRRPATIQDCIDAEVDLIRRTRPDRVIGIFRFTLKASAAVAGVPYDSLICGCMLPDSKDVLGFNGRESGGERQQAFLDAFFRYAAARASRAFSRYGLAPVQDIRSLLKGDRTFLWDFPEFISLPAAPDIHHIGPVTWDRWPYDPVDTAALAALDRPLAVVAFGTCVAHAAVAERITKILLDLGYHVLLAAGGQKTFLNIALRNGHLTVCSFAPLPAIFPHADLLVSHGGQMTVFEALQEGVPVLVIPFQPEQAHNGVCLERVGCGGRLIPSQCFTGDPGVYLDALSALSDEEIATRIRKVVHDPGITGRLSLMQDIMGRYHSMKTLAAHLEGA